LAGSDAARNDVLAGVIDPDGGIVAYLVNRQSQVKQFTDQRLVIHAYDFDLLGRQAAGRHPTRPRNPFVAAKPPA
jgi:hypothetical protein